MEYDVKLLEECSDEQGVSREQYWYDTLTPLYNYMRPGQTRAEYKKTEVCKLQAQRYYQAHKQEYYERKMKYRASKQNAIIISSGQSNREPR